MGEMISVFMPTFGRLGIVDEAVESFLRQDYPDKELVIVNDHPNITLKFDNSGVKVFNTKRFDSLGEKQNFAVDQCSGKYFVPFNDDDIVLPWALSYVYELLKKRVMCLEPRGYYVITDGKITYEKGCINTSSIIHKEAYKKVNGYPDISAEVDCGLRDRLHKSKLLIQETIPKNKTFMILGRNSGVYHLMDYPKKDRWDKVFENSLKEYPDKIGYEISPHWKHDYEKIVKWQ